GDVCFLFEKALMWLRAGSLSGNNWSEMVANKMGLGSLSRPPSISNLDFSCALEIVFGENRETLIIRAAKTNQIILPQRINAPASHLDNGVIGQ
ncbi:MAG TPA: hypothetical protein VFZ34_00995, partial [Blastocatellia bacterium]|nr:hypothetical protein [Blastocatellia bacterium]